MMSIPGRHRRLRLIVLLALSGAHAGGLAESRISVAPVDSAGTISSSSRVRFVVNVPQRLQLEQRGQRFRTDGNAGTTMLGCFGARPGDCAGARAPIAGRTDDRAYPAGAQAVLAAP